MQPYQERVIDEKVDLDARREKLTAFIDENPMFDALPEDEQKRLERQALIMAEYSAILGARIEAFDA